MPSSAYAACAVGVYAWQAGANGRLCWFATAGGAVATAVTGNARAKRSRRWWWHPARTVLTTHVKPAAPGQRSGRQYRGGTDREPRGGQGGRKLSPLPRAEFLAVVAGRANFAREKERERVEGRGSVSVRDCPKGGLPPGAFTGCQRRKQCREKTTSGRLHRRGPDCQKGQNWQTARYLLPTCQNLPEPASLPRARALLAGESASSFVPGSSGAGAVAAASKRIVKISNAQLQPYESDRPGRAQSNNKLRSPRLSRRLQRSQHRDGLEWGYPSANLYHQHSPSKNNVLSCPATAALRQATAAPPPVDAVHDLPGLATAELAAPQPHQQGPAPPRATPTPLWRYFGPKSGNADASRQVTPNQLLTSLAVTLRHPQSPVTLHSAPLS
ncbi:hypothetical protein AOQ84DRAFT_221189, partial [Glonium stellatum]